MYNNPYMNYNSQASIDKLNEQINNLERMKLQMQQQPVQQPITQNFQLAPTNRDVIKYAASIDEVQRDMVIGDTPYFSKDMSVVWIKNTKGDIKTYELNEIIPKDEKDMQIELLQAQIDELKKGLNVYGQSDSNVISTETTTNTARDDESTRTTTKENKSTSVSTISTSKKR